ncbi:unnamed protein product [Pleuronectes platessa]|uniref:RHD domain-containing protein n=1 Tax=Pleuronectes platessa TaxID=8262 RepID=A0A9N7VAI7_PLEPL|nr:unnamed protein product [Pleuronectes platessa]
MLYAYGYTPNVSLSLTLGNPCLPSQYHSLQSSPVISVSVPEPLVYDTQDDMRAAGYYSSPSSRPNGAPTLESPRIEITAYGQFPEDAVEESSLPVAKRVNSIVTLTLPSGEGYRDPSCLSPASSISSRSCHSDASYESSFSYNYDNSPQNSPWQSPSVSPKGSTLALPGDGCAAGGSPSTSPRTSITDDTWMGQRGSRPNSPCGAKRKYSLNGSRAPHKHYPYSPNHSPGLSPQTSPRLSVTEESWLPNTNQYTNSAILAAINALTTDGVVDLGEGIPMKARKTSLEHNPTVSLKVEPGSEELSPGHLCDDEHSNRMLLKKEGYCGGFLDVPQHPYSWSKPKQYVSPSLPALDWQLPSSSGPYSLQIDVQPKSHHRAHYETEGSRGAVKAMAGGHPVIQSPSGFYGSRHSRTGKLKYFCAAAKHLVRSSESQQQSVWYDPVSRSSKGLVRSSESQQQQHICKTHACVHEKVSNDLTTGIWVHPAEIERECVHSKPKLQPPLASAPAPSPTTQTSLCLGKFPCARLTSPRCVLRRRQRLHHTRFWQAPVERLEGASDEAAPALRLPDYMVRTALGCGRWLTKPLRLLGPTLPAIAAASCNHTRPSTGGRLKPWRGCPLPLLSGALSRQSLGIPLVVFRPVGSRGKVLGSNPTPVRALDVSRVNPVSAVIGSSSPATLTEKLRLWARCRLSAVWVVEVILAGGLLSSNTYGGLEAQPQPAALLFCLQLRRARIILLMIIRGGPRVRVFLDPEWPGPDGADVTWTSVKLELGSVTSRARGSQITAPLAAGGFTAPEIRLLQDQHLGRTHLHGYMESEPLTLQLFIGTADDRLLRPHAFYQVHRITGKTVSTPSHEALHNNTKVLEIPLLPENNMRAM